MRGRIALQYDSAGGYVENLVTGNQLKSYDSLSTRLKLHFDVSEETIAKVQFNYSDYEADTPAARSTIGAGLDSDEQHRQVSLGLEGQTNREIWGASLTFKSSVAGHDVVSITAYGETKYDFVDDAIGVALPLTNDAVETSSQFTQELRLSRDLSDVGVSYMIGLYYLDENIARLEAYDSSGFIGVVGASRALFDGAGHNKSLAAFSNVDWSLTDSLSMTFGARYTSDKKQFRNEATTPDVFGFLLEDYTVAHGKKWTEFTP